jgi:hypothetical protein
VTPTCFGTGWTIIRAFGTKCQVAASEVYKCDIIKLYTHSLEIKIGKIAN